MKLLKITVAILLLGAAFQVGRDSGAKRGWFAEPPAEDLDMNVKFEPPGPAPPEPDPPPYAPEGYDWVRYDLARHVYFAARRVDRPEEAAKLGTAIHYAVVLSDNDSPVGKLHEVRLVTGKVLATEDAMEPWRDFGIEVSAALQALYRKGKLSTPAEWNSALRGISEGLILAGPDK